MCCDVRMIQRRERLRFALEARQTVRISRDGLGQHLDGDLPRQVGVRRPIHLAHAAHANLGGDFVRAEACARRGPRCRGL